MKQKVLVLVSIITSVLSATVGLIQRFISTLTEIDAIVIFFSGIFLLLIVAVLLYFMIREVIRSLSENAKEEKRIEQKEREYRRRKIARNKNKKK